MAETRSAIDGQLKSLTKQVEFLQTTVDELSARLGTLERGKVQKEKQQDAPETIPSLQKVRYTKQHMV